MSYFFSHIHTYAASLRRRTLMIRGLLLPALMLFVMGSYAAESSLSDNPAPQRENNNFSTHSPIEVDADEQNIDLEKDTLIFIGDVIAKQDTLLVKGDKIVIEDMSSDDQQVITATGKPVYFEQWIETKNGQELVKGNGSSLVYYVANETLVLTGNAIVYKQDGTVKGNVITYHLNDSTIHATSGSGQRVNTVIIPNTAP